MRWEVDVEPVISAHTDFSPATAAHTVQMLSPEEAATRPDDCVSVRSVSEEAFLTLACFEENMLRQLVGGKMRIKGSPDRLARFRSAIGKIIRQ